MKVHTVILNLCLLTSAVCLGAGFILGGYWLVLPVFPAMAIFWMIMKRRSQFWLASSLLVAYVILAVIGVTLNLSIYLMILGCAAALACWDLIHFRQSIDDNPPHESDVPLERYRVKSLATVVFTGLLLAFIGSSINLQFSFGVMIFFVLAALGCLIYGVRLMLKNH